jgi:hypothetical protein
MKNRIKQLKPQRNKYVENRLLHARTLNNLIRLHKNEHH